MNLLMAAIATINLAGTEIVTYENELKAHEAFDLIIDEYVDDYHVTLEDGKTIVSWDTNQEITIEDNSIFYNVINFYE